MAKPKSNPTIAIAYLRVSTEDQNLGPEAQRRAVTEAGELVKRAP